MAAAAGSFVGPAFVAAWVLGCLGLYLYAFRIVVRAAQRRGWSRWQKIVVYAASLWLAVPVAVVVERQDRLAHRRSAA